MIHFVITYSGETEVYNLLESLLPQLNRESHHVWFLCDRYKVNMDVTSNILNTAMVHVNAGIKLNELNNDFAQHRNSIHDGIEDGQYIVQLDSDETVSIGFVEACENIVSTGLVDVAFIPRVNTVEGITQAHIDKWGWRKDSRGRINYPDYQGRLYRKDKDIRWVGKVHERVERNGNNSDSTLSLFYVPTEQEKMVIYHPKTIDRQQKQNDFYDTI